MSVFENGKPQEHLLMMACSAMKARTPEYAMNLYQGVMYQTFHSHVREFAQPTVVILSAEYGFVSAGSFLRPYERRMTAERGKEIIGGLDQEIHKLKWLSGMRHVYLAGGQTYQSVMRACIDRLKSLKVLPLDIVVEGTHGALGFQRAQLGAYLRSLPDARDVVGHHPNGTPIEGTHGDSRLTKKSA